MIEQLGTGTLAPGTGASSLLTVAVRISRLTDFWSERGLNPLSTDDHNLLKAIGGGEFIINGFRNKDIRQILFGCRKLSEPNRKKGNPEKSRENSDC